MWRRIRQTCVLGVIGIGAIGSGVSARAQAAQVVPVNVQRSTQEDRASVQTPLKLTVVITRHQGERELIRLPYELTVYPGERTSLTMQLEVPVPTSTTGPAGEVTSYQYRRAGTSITAGATALEGGRFQVQLTVDESRVLEPSVAAGGKPSLGRFSSFQSSTPLLLQDGQTQQYTAATDPVSGEVARISVTLNVIK
jgi:hypothetical protein